MKSKHQLYCDDCHKELTGGNKQNDTRTREDGCNTRI